MERNVPARPVHVPARPVHVLGALLATALPALSGGCTTSRGVGLDLEELLHAKQAFLDAWTVREGETFALDKLERVIDTSSAFVSFDAMSKDKTVVRGYDEYAAIWGPGMRQFRTASLTETESVHIWIREGMAITGSLVRIQGTLQDGTPLDFPGHLTLGWLQQDGRWRAIHEHMSLGVKQ